MSRLTTLDFDVWHDDGLLFEESPELFVRLETVPIIFTVRGVRYFLPRFRQVGVELSDIKTEGQFAVALDWWLQVEFVLLQERTGAAAAASRAPNPHQVLQAILQGDIEGAERALARLKHCSLAGLRLV